MPTGAGSYIIVLDTCGAPNREITAGKIIVPTQAYRDEGLPTIMRAPADYIATMKRGTVSERLEEMGLPMCQAVPDLRRHLQGNKSNSG